MSRWPSTKARKVLRALERLGWVVERRSGSHRTLSRPGWKSVTWAHHEGVELGPKVLARLAKRTGLRPEDL